MTKIYKDKSGSFYGTDVALNVKQQEFNSKCVVNYCQNLSSFKWSNNSICALLGNMSFESGVNPMREEVEGSGYGLVQWTPKSILVSRSKTINQYKTYDSMFTQLSVIDYECKSGKQWIKTEKYNISFKEFIEDTTHDINYLTGAWLLNYERPNDKSDDNINKRCYGDNNGHIGSIEWSNILNFDNSGDKISFLKWCEKIANDNTYLYKYGSAHGVDWNYSDKYFDCSSFVSFGLYNGGYDLETQFSTSNQKQALENIGFNIKPFKSNNNLKSGDILFYNNINGGHTEIVYKVDNGVCIELVGAHTDELPNDKQISICNYFDDTWQYIATPNDSGNNPKPFYIKNKKHMNFIYPKRK